MNRSARTQPGLPPWRLIFVGALLVIGFAVVFGRLVQVQILHGAELKELAEDQYLKEMEISAARGEVYDHTGRTLAVSVAVESVFVDPRRFERGAAPKLAKALGLKAANVERRVAQHRSFAWIKRRINPAQADAVRALKLKGVHFTTESKRYYPNRDMAAHVLGFVGLDGKGLAGVERSFDKDLHGRSADIGVLRDAHGRRVSTGDILPVQDLEGDKLYLSIDAALQELTEESLARAVAEHQAKAGMAVVLDPHSGAILAMANVPTFNPNDPGQAKSAARRNRVVTDVYEPGSTMKPLVVAAALNEGVIKADDIIYCENGAFKVGRHTIRDTHRHGNLSVSEIIAKSSNIGALKIGRRLGAKKLYGELKKLGFGSRTGIKVPGEVAGLLAAPKHWSDARLATISFGQGIGVSALQMAAALGTIAAGGVWHQPYLVDRQVTSDGTVLYRHGQGQDGKKNSRRVFSERTARQVAEMMEGVVKDGGTGRRAAIKGIRVAGKTGTSQKADLVTGGYSKEKRIGSFVGFAPVQDPKAVVLVVIDEPQGASYGGVVAAPAFREIMLGTLAHFGVSVEHEALAMSRHADDDSIKKVASGEARELSSDGISDDIVKAPALVTAKGQMPDLRGLDMRRAAAAALSLGLELRISGRGRVIDQTPPAGASLEGVEALQLLFQAKGQG